MGRGRVGVDTHQGLTRALIVSEAYFLHYPNYRSILSSRRAEEHAGSSQRKRAGPGPRTGFHFRRYIIWLISANNCVIISHVLWDVIDGPTGQNDKGFSWVGEPETRMHECYSTCTCCRCKKKHSGQ